MQANDLNNPAADERYSSLNVHNAVSSEANSAQGSALDMQTTATGGQMPVMRRQNMQMQASGGQMPGVQQVQQQVENLRQTLHSLMMDKQYADGELVSRSADLDQQLQIYLRMLNDKKQPGMRTF